MTTEIFNEQERETLEATKIAIRTQLRILLADLPTEYYNFFKGCVLTGGAIASLIHGETPNDWDVYLENMTFSTNFTNLVEANANNIQETIKEVTPNYRSTKIRGLCITENAITFKNGLQVITCNDKNARKTFDFIHCMPYFDMATQQLYISRAQYDSIINKELVRNPASMMNTLHPYRVEKYMDRGWKIKV